MKATTDDLPETLSGLLNLAINSMRTLDREAYLADWGEWHLPRDDGFCHVCFAGAVMALYHEPDKSIIPSDRDTWMKNRLNALDEMRMGYVGSAAETIGIDRELPVELEEVMVLNEYFRSWGEADEFLGEMEWLRDKLIKEGF